MKCDHGIRLNRYCVDCELPPADFGEQVLISNALGERIVREAAERDAIPEETPAEHRRRWLSTFLLIVAFLMGLGALALAARLVFEWLGGAA